MENKREDPDTIDQVVRNGRYQPNSKNQWFSNFQAARGQRLSSVVAEQPAAVKSAEANDKPKKKSPGNKTGTTPQNVTSKRLLDAPVLRKRRNSKNMSMQVDSAYLIYDPKTMQNVVKVKSDESNAIDFNMNNLPGITQLRVVLIILCVLSFLAAPFVYMPLGVVQAKYDQKCFLYAKLKYQKVTVMTQNGTYGIEYKLLALKTDWSPGYICDFTTYTAVSTAIFSLIVGWLTIQLWPDIMADGGGGTLAVCYATMSILCLASNFTSSRYIMEGFNSTCANIKTVNGFGYGLQCQNLNGTLQTRENKPHNTGILYLLNGTMDYTSLDNRLHSVMIASWTMTGLAFFKILLSAYAYFIIWYYCYYDPQPIYEIPVMAAMSLSTIQKSITSSDMRFVVDEM